MTYKIPHPTSWPRCYLKDRADYLPGRAGVYAVMDARGHIYYIGKAKNLTNRWSGASHHRYQQAVDQIENPLLAWKTVDGRSLTSVETALIRTFRQQGQADWNYTPEYQPRQYTINHDSGDYEPDHEPFPWVKAGIAAIALMVLNAMCQSQSPTQRPSPAVNGTPVFSQPVYGAAVVDRIPGGSSVRIGQCSGDFVKVTYEGSTGWVRDISVSGHDCD